MSPPKRSKSSRKWLDEHFNDDFVQRAQKEKYRSRAAYKLLEIQEKDKILKPGSVILDLGAAPGGWSQVAADIVCAESKGVKGVVIATDILPMEPIPEVTFIEGDFTEQACLDAIMAAVNTVKNASQISLVMSDMAPNMSGIKGADQARAMYLAELAFELAQNVLCVKGDFLVKVFQGEGFDNFLKNLRLHFEKVVSRKPKASRARSREIYLLARGYKPDKPVA